MWGSGTLGALSESVPDQYLSEWRQNDKYKIKSYIQISSIFELDKRYQRALALLRKARARVTDLTGEALLLFGLNSKMGRLHLLLGRSVEAARLFREVIAFQVSDKKFPVEIAGWLSCSLLNNALPDVGDAAFQTFAEALDAECAVWPQARAAILLWYTQGLFDRLLVQKGRILMREAEDAARESKAYRVMKMVFEEKLFRRTPQVYSTIRRPVWTSDVITAVVDLSQDLVPDEVRSSFAKTFRGFCSMNAQTMHSFEAVFAEHQAIWDKHPFEIATLALWRTSRELNLSTQLSDPLRAFLALRAPFLLDL